MIQPQSAATLNIAALTLIIFAYAPVLLVQPEDCLQNDVFVVGLVALDRKSLLYLTVLKYCRFSSIVALVFMVGNDIMHCVSMVTTVVIGIFRK